MSDITITGYCAKCNQWFTPDFLATLRLSAHAGGDVCLNCLADKSWGYLKRHVCSADYPKVARYKQFAEIPQLQADNRSLVEQMNQMALQPNQEVIEWHGYPEEKPEPSRCCIVECKNFCYHIAHHSEIDGWLDSVTFDVLSEVKSWAYLPKGVAMETRGKDE